MAYRTWIGTGWARRDGGEATLAAVLEAKRVFHAASPDMRCWLLLSKGSASMYMVHELVPPTSGRAA